MGKAVQGGISTSSLAQGSPARKSRLAAPLGHVRPKGNRV